MEIQKGQSGLDHYYYERVIVRLIVIVGTKDQH